MADPYASFSSADPYAGIASAAPDTTVSGVDVVGKRGIGREPFLRSAAKGLGGILGTLGGTAAGVGETAATAGFGLPAGVATAMAGGTLGYGAGGQVYDLIANLINHAKDPSFQPAQPAWKSALQDLGEGATGEIGGPLISAAAAPVIRGISKAAPGVLGTLTGKGAQPFEQAASAGFNKGLGTETQAAANFRGGQTGSIVPEDILPKVEKNLSAGYDARNTNYQTNIAPISADTQAVPFDPITQAIKDNQSTAFGLRGQVVDPAAASALRDITAEVGNYAKKGWNTPGDLNDLKLAIGNIRSKYEPGTKAFRAADGVYDAVEGAVTDAAPDYANVMKDYSDKTKALQNIRSGLSINNKANTATQISKLLSAMKAAPGAGEARAGMLDQLAGPADTEIKPALAGMALRPWTAGGTPVGTAEAVGVLAGHGVPLAKMASLGVLTSPRIMGATTYGASLAAGKAAKLAQILKIAGISQSPEADKLIARIAGSQLQGNGQ